MTQRPWDRRAREKDEQYARFLTYRDLGLERSLQKVADIYGVSRPRMEQLSRQWDWVARVAEWDNAERERKDREAAEDARRQRSLLARARTQNSDRRHSTGRVLQSVARRLITPPPDVRRDPAKLEAWTPSPAAVNAAANGIARGIEIERTEEGLPSSYTRHDVELSKKVSKAAEVHQKLIEIYNEVMCDECRERVLDRLDELARDVDDLRADDVAGPSLAALEGRIVS